MKHLQIAAVILTCTIGAASGQAMPTNYDYAKISGNYNCNSILLPMAQGSVKLVFTGLGVYYQSSPYPPMEYVTGYVDRYNGKPMYVGPVAGSTTESVGVLFNELGVLMITRGITEDLKNGVVYPKYTTVCTKGLG